MSQQTALDWFFDKLKNHEIQAEHFELYQQAKAMEKEQIVDAFEAGQMEEAKQEFWTKGYKYYTETYKGGEL
jgi:hypothetical protein